MAESRRRRRAPTRTRRRRSPTPESLWPTRFHICIAGLSTNLATRKQQLAETIEVLWESPFRRLCVDTADKRSISTVAQGNAVSYATADVVAATQPAGSAATMQLMLQAHYEMGLRPTMAFLNYEPFEAYAPDPDPVDAGFATADLLDGRAALDFYAADQATALANFANRSPTLAIRYGIYWLEITNKPLLQARKDILIENAEAGVFRSFDILFGAFYAFYEDTAEALIAHYTSYYQGAVEASAAAVAAGYPAFECVPLFRVREQHAPGAATLTDNQGYAIGATLARERVPNACFWFQYGSGDDALLGGLEKVREGYLDNLEGA